MPDQEKCAAQITGHSPYYEDRSMNRLYIPQRQGYRSPRPWVPIGWICNRQHIILDQPHASARLPTPPIADLDSQTG